MKKLTFAIEFDVPPTNHILSMPCPYPECRAKAHEKCRTYRWDSRKEKSVPGAERAPHHDRVAVSLGLSIVRCSTLYRLSEEG